MLRLPGLLGRLARPAVALALLWCWHGAPPASAELAGHGGPVTSVAVSPDGRRALTGGFDYSLMLWDLAGQSVLARLHGHDAAVTAVAFLPPDGRRAVSASDDGTVGLWDLDDGGGGLLHRFEGHEGKVAAVAASPDGRLVASAGWDRTARVWDVAGRRETLRLEGHASNVNAVAFTPDGGRLITGGYDATLRIWRLSDGAQLMELTAHDFGVNAVDAADADGLFASAAADETVRLWNLGAGGEETATLYGHEGPVLAVALSADGRLVGSGGADGTVRVWSAADGERVGVYETRGGGVWSVAFTPDADRLLAAGTDGVVRVWDVADGTEIGAPAGAEAVAALPDAAAPEDGRGAELFRACAACHTVTPDGGNRAGPTLHGLFGRRAGSVPGYPYSEALRDSDIVWTEETVGRLFELGPHEFTPDSKMPLQRMPDDEDRAALIAYLKRVTAPPPAEPGR